MDIVGSLEKSSAGHRYILVISDYPTRYPEAFPLQTITTPKIILALVQLFFSRIGIPEEILTDQGTNFTLQLMGQLNRQVQGWQVQGLLDLLRKSWEDLVSRTEEKGIVQYVLEMRDQLEQYRGQARENLQEAQQA